MVNKEYWNENCTTSIEMGTVQQMISTRETFYHIYLNIRTFNLKAPIATAADDNFFYFSEKTSIDDISCESSALQNFRMSSATNFAWRFKG